MYTDKNGDVNFNVDATTGKQTRDGAREDFSGTQSSEEVTVWQLPPLNPYYWGRHPGESRKDAEARRAKAELDRRCKPVGADSATHGNAVIQSSDGNIEIVGWMTPDGQILTEVKRQELLSDPERSGIVQNIWGAAKPLVIIDGDPMNPAGVAKLTVSHTSKTHQHNPVASLNSGMLRASQHFSGIDDSHAKTELLHHFVDPDVRR